MNCADCGIAISHFDIQWAVANYGRTVCRNCGKSYEKYTQKITKKQFMLDRMAEAKEVS